MRGEEGARVRGGAGLAVGLLLGGAVFSHAHAAGCSKAEILAINDDGGQPRALCIPPIILLRMRRSARRMS
jgi:hypothetical protein